MAAAAHTYEIAPPKAAAPKYEVVPPPESAAQPDLTPQATTANVPEAATRPGAYQTERGGPIRNLGYKALAGAPDPYAPRGEGPGSTVPSEMVPSFPKPDSNIDNAKNMVGAFGPLLPYAAGALAGVVAGPEASAPAYGMTSALLGTGGAIARHALARKYTPETEASWQGNAAIWNPLETGAEVGIQEATGRAVAPFLGRLMTGTQDVVGPARNLWKQAVVPNGASAADHAAIDEAFGRAAKYVPKGTHVSAENGLMEGAQVARDAKTNLWQQRVEPAIQQFSDVSRPMDDVAEEVMGKFSDVDQNSGRGRAAMRAAQELTNQVRGVQAAGPDRGMTVEQMAEWVRQLNNERAVARYYGMSPAEQSSAELGDPALRAKVNLLDSLREKLIRTVGEEGGAEFGAQFADARKDWGALTQVEQMTRDARVPTPANFAVRAANTLRRGPHGVQSTLLDQWTNPNRLASRAFNMLGDSGTGTAPQVAPQAKPPIEGAPLELRPERQLPPGGEPPKQLGEGRIIPAGPAPEGPYKSPQGPPVLRRDFGPKAPPNAGGTAEPVGLRTSAEQGVIQPKETGPPGPGERTLPPWEPPATGGEGTKVPLRREPKAGNGPRTAQPMKRGTQAQDAAPGAAAPAGVTASPSQGGSQAAPMKRLTVDGVKTLTDKTQLRGIVDDINQPERIRNAAYSRMQMVGGQKVPAGVKETTPEGAPLPKEKPAAAPKPKLEPVATRYPKEIIQQAEAEMRGAVELSDSMGRPGRYQVDISEPGETANAKVQDRAWYGQGATKATIAGQYPWFADADISASLVEKALTQGKGADYERIVDRIAQGIAKEQAKGATVTLYRAQPPANRASQLPEWVRNDPEAQKSLAATGAWWTDDPKKAEWYAKDIGTDAQTVTKQVTREEAEAARVKNLPEGHPARRYSADPESEFFFAPQKP